ncbi:MAG TPA: hypothetical protein VN048_00855 [Verrucomicrobiae bacterium]|jgi:hypothetical protein|nr:hypothetical protein [Verrucomicrobiae bacterium]
MYTGEFYRFGREVQSTEARNCISSSGRDIIFNIPGIPGNLTAGTIEHHAMPPWLAFHRVAAENQVIPAFRAAPPVKVKIPYHGERNHQQCKRQYPWQGMKKIQGMSHPEQNPAYRQQRKQNDQDNTQAFRRRR